MNATELRIGNLFQEENSKEIIRVIGLSTYKNMPDDIFFTGNFKDGWKAVSIVLTKYWLLECGFVGDEFGNFENNSRFHLSRIEGYPYFISHWGSVVVGELKYVHEFQNLYFALTKEELTIK